MTNEDLVLYLKLNEGTGTTANDESEYENDGTLVNSPTWVDGKYNKALDLDGINQYVSCGTAIVPTGEITLAVWIKFDTPSEPYRNDSVINKMLDVSPYLIWKIGLESSDSGVTYHFRLDIRCTNTGNQVVTSNINVEAGVWYYIVGTFDGRYLKIYQDGVLYGTVDLGLIDTIADASETVYVGYEKANVRYFNGIIDEVRIYDRALTLNEIELLYLYNKIIDPITDPLSTIVSVMNNETTGLNTTNYEIYKDDGTTECSLLVSYTMAKEKLSALFGGSQDYDVIITVEEKEGSSEWIGLGTQAHTIPVTLTAYVVEKHSAVGSGNKVITPELVRWKVFDILTRFIHYNVSNPGGSILTWTQKEYRFEEDKGVRPILYKVIIETEAMVIS